MKIRGREAILLEALQLLDINVMLMLILELLYTTLYYIKTAEMKQIISI